jgi:4-amino-4-deoxy-L-arabinose transferase-like glycosyltransferase
VALLLLLALIVRGVYWHELSSNPFFEYPIVDAEAYDKIARSITAGNDPYAGRPFFQPPLYPFFLAALYEVTGHDIGLTRLLQMLLGVVNVWLTYRLGRRLLGHGIGLVSGLVMTLYGTMLFFEGELLAPVLIVFLNLLLMLSVVAFFEKPVALRALVAGLLIGASTITMAVVAPFAAIISMYAIIRVRKGTLSVSRRELGAMGLMFLAGIILVIAPVTVRNWLVSKEFVPVSTNAGINFYIGTGGGFDQRVGIRPGYEWQALGEEAKAAGFETPTQQSRYFLREAIDSIRREPATYIKTLAQKLYLFAHAGEAFRNQEIYPFRSYSRVLSVLVWKYSGVAFPYGLLFPFALVGMILASVRFGSVRFGSVRFGAATQGRFYCLLSVMWL